MLQAARNTVRATEAVETAFEPSKTSSEAANAAPFTKHATEAEAVRTYNSSVTG